LFERKLVFLLVSFVKLAPVAVDVAVQELKRGLGRTFEGFKSARGSHEPADSELGHAGPPVMV
jgi:hypothetical protein